MSRPYRYGTEKQYPAAPLKSHLDTELKLAYGQHANAIPPVVRQGYANHPVAQSALVYDQLIKALCVDHNIPGVPEEQQAHWIDIRLNLLSPAQTRDLIQQVCNTQLCNAFFTAQPAAIKPRGTWGVAFVPKAQTRDFGGHQANPDQKPMQVSLPDFFVDYLMPTAHAHRIGKTVKKGVLQRREAKGQARQKRIKTITDNHKKREKKLQKKLAQAQLRVEPLRLTGEVQLDDSGSESSESEAEWDREWDLTEAKAEPAPEPEPDWEFEPASAYDYGDMYPGPQPAAAAAALMPPPAARPDPALAEALRRLETWGEDDPRQAANEATARRAMSQLRRLGDPSEESEEVMDP